MSTLIVHVVSDDDGYFVNLRNQDGSPNVPEQAEPALRYGTQKQAVQAGISMAAALRSEGHEVESGIRYLNE